MRFREPAAVQKAVYAETGADLLALPGGWLQISKSYDSVKLKFYCPGDASGGSSSSNDTASSPSPSPSVDSPTTVSRTEYPYSCLLQSRLARQGAWLADRDTVHPR
jgi:hypothetical protein